MGWTGSIWLRMGPVEGSREHGEVMMNLGVETAP
jgi:hypothetical protein